MTTEKLLRVIEVAIQAYCRVETGRIPYIVQNDNQMLIYPYGAPIKGDQFIRIEVERSDT